MAVVQTTRIPFAVAFVFPHMPINHPDEGEDLRRIPEDWQKTWAKSEDTTLYALPDGNHALVWAGGSGPSRLIGRGALSLEPGPLEWYELDQIRGNEFTSAESAALQDTVNTISIDRIAPYTFPRDESEHPGETLELDHDFIAVEYDDSGVFDALYESLPASSSLSRTELENIISEVHGHFLISAHLEFE
jgi:hypothetical protein